MNILLETALIEKFVRKKKQDRYKQFISSKNRNKFIKELPHFKNFRFELFEEVNANEQAVIRQKLKLMKGNQNTCYIISENPNIDQKRLNIEDAITFFDSGFATILVFGQAEMIFYEGEAPNNKFISKV